VREFINGRRHQLVTRSTSSFGIVGTEWQARINLGTVAQVRLNARRMKRHGLGALLVMYDENVRSITSTYAGWCGSKARPAAMRKIVIFFFFLRSAEPVLFEQGVDMAHKIKSSLPLRFEPTRRYGLIVDQSASWAGLRQQVKQFPQRHEGRLGKYRGKGPMGVDLLI